MSQALLQERMVQQRTFFFSGATRSVEFRRAQLKKLRDALLLWEPALLEALHKDLNKPALEAYGAEIRPTRREIDFALKHLDRWVRPQRVASNWLHFPLRSSIYSEPLGNALILAPWNYPVFLLLSPLVGAIAAGNCAVLKPSELAPATAQVLVELIQSIFPSEYIAIQPGDSEVAQALLEQRWDFIFFTGSTTVGRIVAQAAAKHLTPVVLELGGKSPAIVDSEIDLDSAATRLVWGKFFNAGQTCVAPDYVLLNRSIRDEFINKMKETVIRFYGENPRQSNSYARIINDRHFDRLKKLMTNEPVIWGGQTDAQEKYIAPTLLAEVNPGAPVMQEEIFGPVLPVVTYDDLSEAIHFVRSRPKPLALYFFSNNPLKQARVLDETSSGGVVLNDTLVHLDSHSLPFGGVGESGMGSYHGYHGFRAFSHQKAVVKRWLGWDFSFKFPPYKIALRWARRLLG